MGLLNGAIHIGRSALTAYQGSLEIVGQNVANAATPGYTRLSPILSPEIGVGPDGRPLGVGGVSVSQVKRNVDVALESRLRSAISDDGYAKLLADQLGRAESVYNELSDVDLGSRLDAMFNAFHQVSQTPEDLGVRQVAIEAGNSLAAEFARLHQALRTQQDDLNRDLQSMGESLNELSSRIAELNVRIVEGTPSSPDQASTLRDQRDQALRDLAELIDIDIREQTNGSINVYAGNEVLVQFGQARRVKASAESLDGQQRTFLRFADNGGRLDSRSGQVGGLLRTRDQELPDQLSRLDELAKAVIFEVNKLHAEGVGLGGQDTIEATVSSADPTAPLNSTAAQLPFAVKNGSMLIRVIDQATGQVNTTQVTVNLDGIGGDDMSLNGLASAIDAIDDLSASVGSDGRLRITVDTPGKTFAVTEDTSQVMAALGIGGFFAGTDAQSMAVSQVLQGRPDLLAAGFSGEPGDGGNAARIAQLQSQPVASLSDVSIPEYHRQLVARLGAVTAASRSEAEAADSVKVSVTAQRAATSGVSLDEEAVNMMVAQRAYQGAARYMSTVQQLMDELLRLV